MTPKTTMGILAILCSVAVVLCTTTDEAVLTAGAQTSSGCGNSHHAGYNNNSGDGFSLGNRTYTVLVPVNYDPTRAYPLIVDFHGHDGSSDGQYQVSQYDKFDTQGDFLVVYPQGVKYSPNGGKPQAAWEGPTYADPTVDDQAFTANLVQHMQASYCVDSDRVYASGKSNGAGFVGTLACSAQGALFAAFAMSSAALYTDNLGAGPTGRVCTPSRSVTPIMEVHGSKDGTISYDGGKESGGFVPPIPSWLATWASRDSATGEDEEYPSPVFGNRVNVTTWSAPGTSTTAVEGIWIQGMDHCWASVEENGDWTTGNRTPKKCRAPLNATSLFLDFFNTWDLNGLRG